MRERFHLERLHQRELYVPQSVTELQQMLDDKFKQRAFDSAEFGDLMRLLVPEFHVYLVRLPRWRPPAAASESQAGSRRRRPGHSASTQFERFPDAGNHARPEAIHVPCCDSTSRDSRSRRGPGRLSAAGPCRSGLGQDRVLAARRPAWPCSFPTGSIRSFATPQAGRSTTIILQAAGAKKGNSTASCRRMPSNVPVSRPKKGLFLLRTNAGRRLD